MRIVVTDTALIWNHDNPALEQIGDAVLVVCLNGKKVTDKYKCFVSPYNFKSNGVDNFSVESNKYRMLELVADDLLYFLVSFDDILFLTDGNPESLYPFHIIKARNRFNNMHLCAMSPWNFDSTERRKAYRELLSDLSHLRSVLYMDSNTILAKVDSQIKYPELMQKVSDDYSSLLPRIINGVQQMQKISYYDFTSNSYVPLEDGFDEIDLSKPLQNSQEILEPLHAFLQHTLGLILPPDYPGYDESTKKEIEQQVARIDGKKTCNFLRNLRIQVAEANGIDFFSEVCPSVGPCAGTCAKCDRESDYLRKKLSEIPENERVYPKNKLTEWEVQ